MALGKLTQGMASTDHIHLGNHDVICTNGSVPITSFYPIQANRMGSLGPVVQPHPKQHLHSQWSVVCQGMHKR
jgi:hypothetical protein